MTKDWAGLLGLHLLLAGVAGALYASPEGRPLQAALPSLLQLLVLQPTQRCQRGCLLRVRHQLPALLSQLMGLQCIVPDACADIPGSWSANQAAAG